MNTTELILIRGIPGSGKTTMAKQCFPGYPLVEADQFFVTRDGYVYDPSRIKEAHRWCQERVFSLLSSGENVVVANTFVRRWELQPYIDMARTLGSRLSILIANGDYKNVHGVPEAVIQRMKDQFEY